MLPDQTVIAFDEVGERKTILVLRQFLDDTWYLVDVMIVNNITGNLDVRRKIQWATTWPPESEPKCGFLSSEKDCSTPGECAQFASEIVNILLRASSNQHFSYRQQPNYIDIVDYWMPVCNIPGLLGHS